MLACLSDISFVKCQWIFGIGYVVLGKEQFYFSPYSEPVFPIPFTFKKKSIFPLLISDAKLSYIKFANMHESV